MQSYYYKSEAPEVVAIVQEFYQAKDRLNEQLVKLGEIFGGKVAPMCSIDSHFAGGVKLPADRALDVHWRRPDEWGFRTLRNEAVLPKGLSKEQRAGIRAEHERLRAQWKEHCPESLSSHGFWERLTINTGNLLLCGGIKFEHQGAAYFHLGFSIDQIEHEENIAAGKPSSGWISGAVEILPREYEAARVAKLGERA
ncbi:hypothetical protein CXQ81_03960 [Pseudomonas sp. 09C 129]|uniref:hypothetical protein n=1 Tax=Pseudomonas sp. 09C 129 TaxID=2054915 RepID=UPI000C6CEF5B|nr:hypothetical protein [Pseudomonas sp. 09C 129]AUF99780.1 hypothetical protein CXQ81_03960 [Pseudomonas sp. 09C 129]